MRDLWISVVGKLEEGQVWETRSGLKAEIVLLHDDADENGFKGTAVIHKTYHFNFLEDGTCPTYRDYDLVSKVSD